MRQTDIAGNVSPLTNAVVITFDTKAPVQPKPPTLNPLDDSGSSNSDNITSVKRPRFQNTTPDANLAAEAALGTVIQLVDAAGNVLGQAPINANGTYSVQPVVNLADGAYQFQVRAVDKAGNISPLSARDRRSRSSPARLPRRR